MQLKPIKHKRIYEEVVSQIKEMVVDGSLNPGDRLLSERELADRLKVSRASIREALTAMEVAGLVEIRPGEGTFIKDSSVDAVIEPLAILFILERDKMREFLQVRKALEVEAISIATANADEEDFAKIERALEQMEMDLKTGESGERADLLFHYAIAEASKNSLLLRLMNTIYDTMNQTLKATRELWLKHNQETPERLLEEHQEMVAAMKEGKWQNARDLMYKHLTNVEEELNKFVTDSEG